MKAHLKKILESLARPLYSGIGAILCFHRIVDSSQRSVLSENRALELTPRELDALIGHIRKGRYGIIPLDEVPGALSKPPRGKFIAFTFDDGYLDTFTHALPIFRAHEVPFTVNITTSFASHTGLVWWHLLECLLLRDDPIRYCDGERTHELPAASLTQKNSAFEQLARRIRNGDQTQRDAFIQNLFAGADIDPVAVSATYMMDWETVRRLAADPLVTIGAHTVRHLTLNRLDPALLRSELLESKTTLETELRSRINHLAYPFGGPSAVGPREFETASECGFVTAVTTRGANLFSRHASHPCCLPRISMSGNDSAINRFCAFESGLVAARRHPLRPLITD